ncbi:hypothetical protein DFQ01_10199 [Paenibacillus cellulosilyticus]|uniref:Uncharacterized protein n=1 Tax=Paenibacillus cellulosilyticus TaxID=375489 RepID=A0A2V2YZG5_9BACL|nr:DUF5693 family protein [Paenibacillus cellulosilyticus]PWW08378.1 hypothetical protein DFQ01_10199 [Paenibacillus cellulosilyticus]QKS47972.1 hypothetical protein HUB94_27140 [Paenibacillus cellulosilyticus]
MLQWQQWNRKFKAVLWTLALVGVVAALPLGVLRWQMEGTSKQVEYVMNYKDIELVASYQYNPAAFIDKQLEQMKAAGVTTMAVFEATLDDLVTAKRLNVYNQSQLALLQGKAPNLGLNETYVLFAGNEEEQALKPLITSAFERAGISVSPWAMDGRSGLQISAPIETATLISMDPDPIAMDRIHAAGFRILPRISDRIRPYNETEVRALLEQFKSYGVDRILFDGSAVKGFNDNAELHSLNSFAALLKEEGIGIAAIEGLKSPQSGFNTLAYLTDYNVVRLHSIPSALAATISPETLKDRFLLAAKDRNIRMFYLNAGASRSLDKGGVVDPLDKLVAALQGPDGTIQKLADFGFSPGPAEPFDVDHPSWTKAAKAIVCLGAVSMIALLIGAFANWLTIIAFVLGVIGSGGLYVLSKSTLEQGLALGAAISAPTLALIWVLNVIRRRTEGNRRNVGGEWSGNNRSQSVAQSAAGFEGATGRYTKWTSLLGDVFGIGRIKWIFNGIPAGQRFGNAITLFVFASLISMLGIPYVFGLLNNITYSLLLEQFRGVSLLHLAPIFLVALYLFLYMGSSVLENIRKLLSIQITVFWVIVVAVLGVVGLYYLSRTGNEGQASSLEMMMRNTLETTFGVRPRSKEFLLAHPLLLLGLFLALRYRAAWVLVIVGSIGQLSMVDTFAHIHTPLQISLIRDLLGLCLGAAIGCVLIAVWQLGEGVWRRWVRPAIVKYAE